MDIKAPLMVLDVAALILFLHFRLLFMKFQRKTPKKKKNQIKFYNVAFLLWHYTGAEITYIFIGLLKLLVLFSWLPVCVRWLTLQLSDPGRGGCSLPSGHRCSSLLRPRPSSTPPVATVSWPLALRVQNTHRTTETSNPCNIKKLFYFNWLVNHFNNVCSRNELTDCVDFVGKLSGAEGAGVRGDALVEQVDDVAVPASLCEGGNNQPHDTCRCELTQCCLSMRKVKHVSYKIKTFKMSHWSTATTCNGEDWSFSTFTTVNVLIFCLTANAWMRCAYISAKYDRKNMVICRITTI